MSCEKKEMQKVKLFFTRRAGADDIIQMFDDETHVDMVRVVYTPGDHTKKSNEFYLTSRDVLSYVNNILKAMNNDIDPFEYVQLQTAIHPTILFSAMDVGVRRTQDLIDDMIFQSIRVNVAEIKLKRTIRTPVEGQ
jgi:hypothetical protein